jgi:hypothetical protein
MGYECDIRQLCVSDPQPVQATKLVTDLTNGDVTAACEADWGLLVITLARQLEAQQAEPDATDDQGDESDEDSDQDQAALARLAAAQPPAAPDPQVAKVVKRGTSASRKAHQAKRTSQARNQLPRPVPVPAEGAMLDDLAAQADQAADTAE